MDKEKGLEEKEAEALNETTTQEDVVENEVAKSDKEESIAEVVENTTNKGEETEQTETANTTIENTDNTDIIENDTTADNKKSKETKKNDKAKSRKEKAKDAEEKAIKIGKFKLVINKKITAIVLVLCLLIAGGAMWYYKHSQGSVPIDLKSEERVSSSEQKQAMDKISQQIKGIRDGNGYFNLIDGKDTSETYVFNSHGEAIAQGSKDNYISVFKKDGVSVRFTDVIASGPDLDILKLMENSLALVNSKDAVMTKPLQPVNTNGPKMDFYYVSLSGWDNIKKLYTPVSEEFANNMIDTMKKSVPEGKEIKIRFKYIVGDSGQFSTGCELLMDDKEYTLWYFDGYLLLYDWQLPDEWYTADFKDAKKADEMLTKLLTDLDSMFKKYADDNNLPSKEETEKKKADEAAKSQTTQQSSGAADSSNAKTDDGASKK